jgi:hypothetical protein
VLYSTLSSYTTTDSPLCFACRYSNRLSAALLCLSIPQLTIRSALSGDTPTDYPLYQRDSLLSLASLQPTIICALLYLAIPYYNQLSSVLCLPIFRPTIRRSTLPVDITTDYLLYRLSAVLSLAILQPTVCCALSVWRYNNREYGLLCLSILVQPTIRSALSVDTTIDYPLYDYLLYRLSALLSLALLQSTICCDLLGLPILQPTFLCALFHSVCQHHYNRLSAQLRDSDGIISEQDSQLCLAIPQPTICCASLLPL